MTITYKYRDSHQNGLRTNEAPPLGLRERWVVDELRLQEIHEAVFRFFQAGQAIPGKWLDEYKEIAQRSTVARFDDL
jgi:hypothetical protein